MMVDRREFQRLRRLERQRVEGMSDVETTVRNLGQQIANVLALHTSAASSAVSSVEPRSACSNRSRDRKYSSKIPSTSPSVVTACNRRRNSAEPGSPFAYQPRCLRNSI